MKRAKPVIDKNILTCNDLSPYIKKFKEEDLDIENIWLKNSFIENEDLNKLCFRGVIFENCRFIDCELEAVSFIHVIFRNCDFSNSNLKDSYFSQCEIVFSKFVGTDIWNASLKDVLVETSNFQYANLHHVNWKYIEITNSDFSNATLSECKLGNFEAKNTKFLQTNFFKTPLRKIDFRENEFAGIIVSDTYSELRGIIINDYQAAEIVKLLGVTIK